MREKDESPDAIEGLGAFSPIENEAPLRWWRLLRIVPTRDIGAGRRAVLLAALTWLPIALWALAAARFVRAESAEPFLQHYGIHIRYLVAVPLFIMAEAVLHRAGKGLTHLFVRSGVVTPALRPAFDATIRDVIRLRDTSLPWVGALGVAVAWSIAVAPDHTDDLISWALNADGGLSFGGWWLVYVARPIFLALLLGWIWRIALVTFWMWRTGRLGLSFVPTHPDRTGGIAFVEKLPAGFALVTLAMSAVIASRWAHMLVHHGASLTSFRAPALAFAVIWSLLLLFPLLVLMPALRAARRKAEPAYAALVGEQGRLLHRRWIERAPVEDVALLQAPEIGCAADAAAVYHAVQNLRSVPFGKSAIMGIIAPMAVPFLLLASLKIPLKEVLLKLVHVLL